MDVGAFAYVGFFERRVEVEGVVVVEEAGQCSHKKWLVAVEDDEAADDDVLHMIRERKWMG